MKYITSDATTIKHIYASILVVTLTQSSGVHLALTSFDEYRQGRSVWCVCGVLFGWVWLNAYKVPMQMRPHRFWASRARHTNCAEIAVSTAFGDVSWSQLRVKSNASSNRIRVLECHARRALCLCVSAKPGMRNQETRLCLRQWR